MNLKKLVFFTAFSLLFSGGIIAQTYEIDAYNGQTVQTCGGTFYDSGGNAATYGTSESYTVTFRTTNASYVMRATFSAFNTESGYDYLYVYNGPTTASPQIAGSPFNGTTSPGTITATGEYLTFRFTSDGSIQNDGWVAALSCVTVAAPTVQDCQGAIPLCFATYSTTASYSGQGNYNEEIGEYGGALSDNNCPGNCLLSGELNDVWYTFTVANSGTVSFTITPNSSGDDYDWAIYNVTNNTCAQIYNNPALQSSCNFCGIAGNTGPTGGDPQSCEYGDPAYCSPYNAALNVTAGQIYVVNVSNFSSTQSGYSITFGGTAQIVDNVGPYLQALVATPACGQNQFTVRFNENVRCNTVQTGDFTVSGPGGPYTVTAVSNSICSSGGTYGRDYVLTVSPAFTQGGTFTVGLVANSVSDICSHPTGGQTLNFTVTGVSASASVSSHVTCNGLSNGTATASGSGGTAPYSYHWDNGVNSATTSTLNAGTHYCTITDAVGACNAVASVTITQPSVITSTTSSTSVSCSGGNNGTATISPSGGTPGYTYSWSSGATTSTATGLTAATYTVTVTDTRGCTHTKSVTVTQPSAVTASITSSTNVSCNGGTNGSATAGSGGGNSPYTYSWSNGQTVATATGLVAGTYTVTVRDANSCSATASVTITQPSLLNASTSVTNANCNGASNGTATVSPSGGTSPYTYSWFPGGATTASISGLAAGTYNVTVTDNRGCTRTASATVGQPSAMTVTTTKTDATCGNSNGSANASVVGGTSPYTYLWSNGGTGASITNILAGAYTVTITDAAGCTKTGTVSVNNTGAPTVSVSGSTNVSCFGGANGSASISASGGTPGYNYSWSNGATGTSISGVVANTYTVTVTDQLGCQASTSVVITQPTSLNASITGNVSPQCYGQANGSATVSASGGTPGYTYSWSNGATTATASSIGAGSYTVTVTDTRGCTRTASVTVTQPVQLSAVISATTPVSCNGGANGTATVLASGGTSPYTYLWSNGASNATATNLSAASYTVTVTDGHSCTSTTTANVIQPAVLLVTIPSVTQVACNGGSTGQATTSATGGTPAYTFSWSNSVTTANNSGLSAGTYSVTVTDANLCTGTSSVTITQPTAITANASILTQISCNGGNNGSATVSASGGTPGYNYSWSNGGSFQNTGGLFANTYYVTVTDINACTTVASVVMSQPDPFAISFNTDSVDCYNTATGSVDMVVVGGTFPYTYQWSNSSGSEDLNNIENGTYNVTITDANFCTATQSVTVYEPTDMTATAVVADAHCGLADGSLAVTAVGATPGYTYLWDANAGSQTTATATALYSGSYDITITDSYGCPFTFNFSVSDQDAALVNFDLVVDNVCFGDTAGFAHATIVSGGTPPFIYNWSNGSVTDSIYNLASGSYNLSLTDASGCVTIQTVIITEPTQLTVQVTDIDSITCYGLSNGGVTVSANGGTPVYSYDWEDAVGTNIGSGPALTGLAAGTYYLTVTDANNCISTFSGVFAQPAELLVDTTYTQAPACFDGVDGAAIVTGTGGTPPYTFEWNDPLSTLNDTISSLEGGVLYTVTITDQNACTGTYSVQLAEPSAVSITLASVPATCSASDGYAYVTASGGIPGYTFSWSNGSTNDTITGLATGTFTVSVYDSHSCLSVDSVVVTNLNAGTLQIDQAVNILCYQDSTGSVTVSMVGGTAPFTYVWSHGGSTQTVNGLPVGNYSVTVTDFNGCMTDTAVTLTGPASGLNLTTSSQDVSCNGLSDGVLMANVLGGSAPYTYLWAPGGATTQTVNGVSAGTYQVTVTDANGCFVTKVEITVGEPAALDLTTSGVDPVCGNGNDGSVEAVVAGGTPPYNYNWSTGAADSLVTGLAAGIYTVTITDNHYCTDIAVVTLYNPPAIVLQDTVIDTDPNTNLGYINVTFIGGTLPYSFNWSNGGTTEDLAGLPSGDYILVLMDANNCLFTDTFTVDVPLEIPTVITPNNDGVNDDFEITNIAAYGDITIEIYNRWGDLLFTFEGTGFEYTDAENRWDGTFNGSDLPMGGYVYIITLEMEEEPITGVISIIR